MPVSGVRKEKAMATIHDYARMCRSFGGRCSICPLNKFMDKYMKNCGRVLFIHASEVSAIIDKWCEEHPQKTYKQDFLEKLPNTNLLADIPAGCRNNFYGWDSKTCERDCFKCWNAAMPDEAEKEEV